MGTLHRAGTTRWSSHFESICGLIDMYGAIISVFECMVNEGSSNTIRGEVGGSLMTMKSFDFIFILRILCTRLWGLRICFVGYYSINH